jgi:predicted RND superfamily exporter protein
VLGVTQSGWQGGKVLSIGVGVAVGFIACLLAVEVMQLFKVIRSKSNKLKKDARLTNRFTYTMIYS